jgi:hypothetical protein
VTGGLLKALVTAGLVLTLSGCGGSDQTGVFGDGLAIEITSGTSFGMCAGYCVTELRIDRTSVTLTEDSQRQDIPTRSEWNRLQSLVDTAAFRRLEGVHGCPDCADGGAEWIQIETAEPVRVTFEYGTELDGIDELQAEIRELRSRFER